MEADVCGRAAAVQEEIRFVQERYDLVELSGVKGKIQGIVFAAVGKPELLLTDVLNQDVSIPANEEKYLFYDEVIGPEGLRWSCLKNWYDNNHLPFDTCIFRRLARNETCFS